MSAGLACLLKSSIRGRAATSAATVRVNAVNPSPALWLMFSFARSRSRAQQAENPSSFFDSLDMDDQKEVAEWRERHQQVSFFFRGIWLPFMCPFPRTPPSADALLTRMLPST